jgi:hypothetical protein
MDMVLDGTLCNVFVIQVSTGTSLDGVGMVRGEFSVSDLAARIDNDERNRVLVESWMVHARM